MSVFQKNIYESFGSRFITANAQTVVLLKQKSGSPQVTIKFMKTRMSIGAKETQIERTPDRGFKLVGERLAIESSSSTSTGETSTVQEGKTLSVGQVLAF